MNGPLEESALHERIAALDATAFFTEPGDVFSYANDGYAIAGDVIAHVTGQPFSAAIRSLVLGADEDGHLDISPPRSIHAAGRPRARPRSGWDTRCDPAVRRACGQLSSGVALHQRGGARALLRRRSRRRVSRASRAPHVEIVPHQRRQYGYGVIVDDNRGLPAFSCTREHDSDTEASSCSCRRNAPPWRFSRIGPAPSFRRPRLHGTGRVHRVAPFHEARRCQTETLQSNGGRAGVIRRNL